MELTDAIMMIIACGLMSLISGLLYVSTHKVDHDEIYDDKRYEEYSREQYNAEVIGVRYLFLGMCVISSIAFVVAIVNLFI